MTGLARANADADSCTDASASEPPKAAFPCTMSSHTEHDAAQNEVHVKMATAGSDVGLDQAPSPRAGALGYVVGNGGALLVGFLVCQFALLLSRNFNVKGWDFFYYFSASRLVVMGLGDHMYDLRVLGHVEQVLARPDIVPHGVIPNIYPPFYALALAPLAALPYTLAYFLWLGLNCFLLAGVLFCLERYGRLQNRGALLFRVATMLSLPVLVALLQGQQSVALLASLTITFFALRAGRETVAGIALSLSLVKPQYVIAFLLVLVIRKHWTALGSFCASALALFALPIPVVGLAGARDYLGALLSATRWGAHVGGFDPVINRGFFGMAEMLLSRPASTVVAGAAALVALGALAYSARRSASLDLIFALAVVVTLLASPHVLIHDLTLLVLPVAVALRHRESGSAPLAVVLCLGYVGITVGYGVAFVAPVQLSVLAMGALGLWLFRACFRESVTTTNPVRMGDPGTRPATSY